MAASVVLPTGEFLSSSGDGTVGGEGVGSGRTSCKLSFDPSWSCDPEEWSCDWLRLEELTVGELIWVVHRASASSNLQGKGEGLPQGRPWEGLPCTSTRERGRGYLKISEKGEGLP